LSGINTLNNGAVSEAYAVTPDGSKIVGYSTTDVTQNVACLWASTNLWQTRTITALPGTQDFYNNTAYGVSADAGVIVGLTGFGGTEEAFYYTLATQIQLVPFSSAQRSSTAGAVTGNGTIIVGVAESPLNEKESAVIATLFPGGYTAIVRGANNTTGVALVEAYGLSP
jgi:uncharacterized membrane protein